jgi:hypothetical protein
MRKIAVAGLAGGFLWLVLAGTGCSTLQRMASQSPEPEKSVLDETVTSENAALLAERARKELSYDDYRLILAYVQRVHPQLPAGSLPLGISLRSMLESQRDFEAASRMASTQAPELQAEAPPEAAPPSSRKPAAADRQPARPATTSPAGRASQPEPAATRPAEVSPAVSTPESSAAQQSAQSDAFPAAPAPPPAPAPPAVATLKSGTEFSVRLAESISSKRNQDGDSFEAVLDQDLVVDGKLVAPEGAKVVGRLTNVKRSGKVEGRATMSLALTELVIGEERFPIRTNRLDFEAKGTGKEDAKKIGIATGIGAAIGAIAGGGKGAAIGGAIGAGAGTGAVLATSGDEVEFGVEQLFNFRLTRDVELPVRR